MPFSSRLRRIVLLAAGSVCLGGHAAAGTAGVPDGTALVATAETDAQALVRLRAERRRHSRDLHLAPDKTHGPARFGLLVIPVDFAGCRLPQGWEPAPLAAALFPDTGQTLHNYFRIASAGKFELAVTLAPLVHLAGTPRDYSDVGLNLFTRTRALARESLEAQRALGLDFSALDNDGPDRLPASGDDDGQVDGVLILHAEIGQENDPVAGLVQALQFFLAEPVTANGTTASFYAVASLHSGLGIWAHETGHLLGMEDRYDPLLRPDGQSEVLALGGLGRFSLMAAGAWGIGDGRQPAMPDAYSALQMGWVTADTLDVRSVGLQEQGWPAATGTVGWLWPPGPRTTEFFLLEARDPAAAAPFDAGLWTGQLLVYHVDETVAEGGYAVQDGGGHHLRVGLVEADGDEALARGENQGELEDLFPGEAASAALPAEGVPSTAGYAGPTGLALNEIRSLGEAVGFRLGHDAGPDLQFVIGFDPDRTAMELVATALGPAFADLECTLEIIAAPQWGTFAGGATAVTVGLAAGDDGGYRPATPIGWEAAAEVPAGATTVFAVRFQDAAWSGGTFLREWVWRNEDVTLDFGAAWPADWQVADAGAAGTTWHRWDGAPWLTADAQPVLVCTGVAYPTSADWPLVSYGNGDTTALTSAPLGPEVGAVRLIHAIEVERRDASTFMDGGEIRWVGQGGAAVPAEPLGGWPQTISPQALNDLKGRGVFASDSLQVRDGRPVWSCDVVPVPGGPGGPWRLQLVFGSNTLWRRQGWFVADLEARPAAASGDRFAAGWTPGQGLTWNWPWPQAEPESFVIQVRAAGQDLWTDLAAHPAGTVRVEGGYLLAHDLLADDLGSAARQRSLVRVLGLGGKGWLATAAVEAFARQGPVSAPALGRPWPNPGLGGFRFMLDVPAGRQGRLCAYDLRGRLVFSRDYGPGRQLALWDARGPDGAPLAAGSYIVRLEGIQPMVSYKVVLLR